ncbi:MAG: Fe-S cluster assembly protein SufD [Thaumarchaeota archaeon 13_1_40CM_3_50_5]|nr:MAG: Fe-S cluster assembly protein SufD [Thaumarchaeota archaeon 13_1_40CM_4_48_7]OLC26677.1 MAG: Fe-S cluster assembly protein SufD [Candidatus Nitrososphaera sp. 13_1_40CM_48_12]OLC79903.1 MAG: Fe-S cluster assembly protein SufD [Thaumarchaeota archaeon 13_1_40CM_3_50_5]
MATSLSSIDSGYVDSLAGTEPGWLAAMRKQAFSQYQLLPAEVSPLYSKYSDINKIKPQNVHFAATTQAALGKDLSDRLKELEGDTGVLQVGQEINKIFVRDSVAKQGVIVSGIQEAVSKHGDLIKSLMEANQLNYVDDKFLALEAAAFQSGVFVYIPKNVALEDPIRLITSLAVDGTSLISRNIVVADTGSKATVVQELYASGSSGRQDVQQGYFELMETHVNPNAHLEMVTLQAMGADTVNVSNRKAFVERDAKMSWYIGMFGSLLSRYKTDSIMKGAGASAEDVEIIFGVGNQSFDVMSNLIHHGQYSRGRVLVKSVLKDTSKSLFKGMIKIGKDGKGAESYLAGHAILLDKGSKSDSIPGLEIETNEVKATHSASVAQIDENQIYYLSTRGLTREGAKREIVSGFLEPLSRKMGPTIRAWVNYLIENKWQGRQLMLRTDEAMEQILEVEKSRYRETQDIFEKHYKYR